MGHTSAIFSPPGTGGILLEQPEGDFRIDHDQKFQQTTNLQYVFSKKIGAWGAVAWRYDSGLVAGAVPDYATALTLTGDQQAAIGLFCGSVVATRDAPLTDCTSADRGAKREHPGHGTADDVKNPPRIAPRHLFDLGFGVDNLFNSTREVRARSIINVGTSRRSTTSCRRSPARTSSRRGRSRCRRASCSEPATTVAPWTPCRATVATPMPTPSQSGSCRTRASRPSPASPCLRPRRWGPGRPLTAAPTRHRAAGS